MITLKPATIKLACGQEHPPHSLDSMVSNYQWLQLHRLACPICAKSKIKER